MLANLHNHTVLLRRGNWIFATYGVLIGAAFLLGVSVALWHDAMAGHDLASRGRFYLLVLVPLVVLGARAFSVLLDWRQLFKKPAETLLKPGYMLHGGVFGGAVAIVAYAAIGGSSPWSLFDSAALAMPVGEAIARFGCLVYGCCWGKPTHSHFGIRYTSDQAKVVRCASHLKGVSIHPTQIYASLAYTALFVSFVVLLPVKPFDGFIAALYLIGHAVIRVILERFREDDRGTLVAGVTHTNLYSGIQILIGVGFLVVLGGGRGMLTPLDMGAHLGDVWSVAGAVVPLILISFGVAMAFGLHRGKVGTWVGNHDEMPHQQPVPIPILRLPSAPDLSQGHNPRRRPAR